MREQSKFLHQICNLALIAAILTGNFSALAQSKTGGKTVVSNQSKQTAPKCSGAWTGAVSYKREQTMTDRTTTPRVSGRGEDKRDWEMKYDYKARAILTEAPEKTGSSVAKASVTHKFTTTEKISGSEKNSCDRGKTWQTMTGDSTTKIETSGNADNLETNVHVGINADGTYTVSIAVPQITGKTKGSENTTFSGQCVPKPGRNFNMPETPATIDGNSLTSDGTHRVDLNDPNRLSGTYTKEWENVKETITWTLRRCGGQLQITDLKFEHPKFPNFDDWQEINEQTGTIDGNWVRIKAKVLNISGETKFAEVAFKETYKGDKWDGARPDYPLKDNTVSVRLDAGEEREVEALWDTQGFAWYDDGRPRLVQRVKTEIWEENKLKDDLTKNVKVSPKPLLFVPGVWTDPQAFDPIYQNLLTLSHSYGWKAQVFSGTLSTGKINVEPGTGINPNTNFGGKSVYDKADDLDKYVQSVQAATNAWHVDMVAHSTGGLVARLYVHKSMPVLPDNYPVVKHLMLLGVPNKGVPCADSLERIEGLKDKERLAKELMPEEMARFNQFVTQKKGTRFSALVGNSIPLLCASPGWNDGFVSVESAKYGVEDFAVTKDMHPDLIDQKNFGKFIKPHIVTGPRGTYPLPVQSEEGGVDGRNNAGGGK